MDEVKIEQLLVESKNKIPVDHKFKRNLRRSFEKKNRRRWNTSSMAKALLGIAAAVLVFIAYSLTGTQPKLVNAEKLFISNARSFMDIAQGDIMALDHQNGQLYLSIKGEGIFHSTRNGLEKVNETEADSISVNSEETEMLYAYNGSIYLLDLISYEQRSLVKGSKEEQWSQPIWKNEKEYYVTKQTGSEPQVVLKSLDNVGEDFIVSGVNSPIAVSDDFIVYEQNGDIMKKEYASDESVFVDYGKSPAVSENGDYITYVKEENGLEDVWIMDSNLETKKKITSNLMQQHSNMAMYEYGLHVWDSKANQLYLIKKRMDGSNVEEIRLAKIELGTQELTSVETVEQFLQALIVRDDDYAKSLMSHPPAFLTVSNPSLKSFNILSTKLMNDVEQVQVEVTFADSHLPYTSLVKLDVQLKKDEELGRYKIESISELERTEGSSEDMEKVQLVKGNSNQHLFSLQDLKDKGEIPNENIRLSSIAYNRENGEVIVAVQEMPIQDEDFGVSLWSYDLKQNTFTFLDRIHSIQSNRDLVLEGITVSPNNKYIALNIFSEGDFTPYLYIMNVETPEKSIVLEQSTTAYWKGNVLYYELHEENQTTLNELNLGQ
ncbi:hypothetical protein ACIQ34_10285 [Ureibacillus sp. NPDC094379]